MTLLMLKTTLMMHSYIVQMVSLKEFMIWNRICPLITITMMKVAPNLHSEITHVSSIPIMYDYV